MTSWNKKPLPLLATVSLGIFGYLLLAQLSIIPNFRHSDALCLVDCQTMFHKVSIAQQVAQDSKSKPLLSLLEENTSSDQISILIDKSAYTLTLFHRSNPIKQYPIVLGGNPTGDKQQEGDKRTPEGIFRIRDQYAHPQWSKFIWLDYPTSDSWRKHKRAKQNGEISPNATIGGEIGIHGVPEGSDHWIDQSRNWTLGCIALKNSDIDEISTVTGPGSIVEIIP